ncbi:M20/M25/M40 family metallo-hydrolase [Paenibacillus albicereus]|uniref:M20/M25/M40 family metallo-hydrolase n=1 Tax=Paenibacillus albicereus TaxID=2726185 RepID=A0A6H2GTI2_9BACL|nr:M20/M25/M40 family metallo-hydrolase [Paenibacillus albicereus]QJC50731.1 M20/M25/M40 family metallo-hydrolase [Paenibacillus albicereus]
MPQPAFLLVLVLPALLIALAAVLLLRAARFRPDPAVLESPSGGEPVSVDADAAAGRLSLLIRKRTVSVREPEAAVRAEFRSLLDLLPELYPAAHMALEREIVNGRTLLYRWRGEEAEAPTVLMSHFDVVPAEEEGWIHPPFSGAIADGRVWGRGAIDTKGTLVCILEAVEQLIQAGFQPRRDVYLSFCDDEEIAGDGAPTHVRLLQERGIRPGLVVDEGGAVVEGIFPGVRGPIAVVGVAEKGVSDFELIVRGAGGHASAPPRLGTAYRLARAIRRLERRPPKPFFPPPTRDMLDTLGRRSSFGYRILFANLGLLEPLLARLFHRLSPETRALSSTTIAVTTLQGSPAANVLPAEARAGANVRVAVGETAEGVAARMRRVIADDAVELRIVRAGDPSPVSTTREEPYRIVAAAIRGTYPEAAVTPYVMLGGSDSRHFAAICPYVYRFTPYELSREERETIHAANESLPVRSLGKGIEFYIRLIRSV